MQLHQLKPLHYPKKAKRCGRGGKRGTYSGRGVKGQKARAGRKLKPIIRELIKRYPKLRGYRERLKTKNQKKNLVIVNLSVLEKKFTSQEIVNPETLFKKGIIDKIKGKLPMVKILGQGEIKKALIIENCYLSQQAEEKIKQAGGIIKNQNSKK